MVRTLAVIGSASILAAVACTPHAPRLGGGPRTAGASRPAAAPEAGPPAAPRQPSSSASLAAAGEAAAPTPTARWNEKHGGLEAADTADCLGCHDERMAEHSHPVAIDYAEAAGRARGGYRTLEEVRTRGVALPGGKVGCLTCHSPASPWAHFLAVPRELARPAVTMVDMRAEKPAEEGQAQEITPPEGAEVSPRPLCESCHAY